MPNAWTDETSGVLHGAGGAGGAGGAAGGGKARLLPDGTFIGICGKPVHADGAVRKAKQQLGMLPPQGQRRVKYVYLNKHLEGSHVDPDNIDGKNFDWSQSCDALTRQPTFEPHGALLMFFKISSPSSTDVQVRSSRLRTSLGIISRPARSRRHACLTCRMCGHDACARLPCPPCQSRLTLRVPCARPSANTLLNHHALQSISPVHCDSFSKSLLYSQQRTPPCSPPRAACTQEPSSQTATMATVCSWRLSRLDLP